MPSESQNKENEPKGSRITIVIAAIAAIVTPCAYLLNGSHRRVYQVLAKVSDVVSWLHWRNNDFTKSIGIVGIASYSLIFFVAFIVTVALFWWLLALPAKKQKDTHKA